MAASAASRVFAVAELYEQILLHVASATKTKIRLSDGTYIAEPNRGLLALTRVDRTTRATIIASPKLQAAKLPWGSSNGDQSNPYEPLIWLFHNLGLYDHPVQRIYYHSREAQEPFNTLRSSRIYASFDEPPDKTYYDEAYHDKSMPSLYTRSMYTYVHHQATCKSFVDAASSWRHFPYSSGPQPNPIFIQAASLFTEGLEILISQDSGVATLGEVYDLLHPKRRSIGNPEKLLPGEHVGSVGM